MNTNNISLGTSINPLFKNTNDSIKIQNLDDFYDKFFTEKLHFSSKNKNKIEFFAKENEFR